MTNAKTPDPTVADEPAVPAMITPPEDEQARRTLWPMQSAVLWGTCIVLLACFTLAWRPTLLWVNAIIAVFYVVVTLYKIAIITASVRLGSQIEIPATEIRDMQDEDLPRYTILVPLFHESQVLPKLIESLSLLDYPKDRLEILLLLEEDDRETRDAFECLAPAAPFRGVIVPESYPRTKPKACDVGLAVATGDYLVIYDAEDRPEPDQLKKAVAGFSRCGPEVICLQAKLNFYNRDLNWFTRWFTTEYSMWYDLYLPGLARFDAPIPLGGTSNHFKMTALKELGGWDPYNVAEDCDLGIRLYKHGYRTRILDSTTWEEACSQIGYWIRQRSRWIKGYMQTFLVHTRRPFQTMRTLGLRRYAHFAILTKGMFFAYLVNPFYWLLTAIWVVFRPETVGEYFPAPVFLMGFFCLFFGNFALVYGNMLGCCRRGYYSLVKYALLIPPYWALISIAAWKACWQLIVNPHYWEKTKHGLDDEE